MQPLNKLLTLLYPAGNGRADTERCALETVAEDVEAAVEDIAISESEAGDFGECDSPTKTKGRKKGKRLATRDALDAIHQTTAADQDRERTMVADTRDDDQPDVRSSENTKRTLEAKGGKAGVPEWIAEHRRQTTHRSKAPASRSTSALSNSIHIASGPSLEKRKRTKGTAARSSASNEPDGFRPGGIKDIEEAKGPEFEFAQNSPPKGKGRFPRNGIVLVPKTVNANKHTRSSSTIPGTPPLSTTEAFIYSSDDSSEEDDDSALASKAATSTRNRKRPQNSDLPKGALDGGNWRRRFIPTVFSYHGSRLSPWGSDSASNGKEEAKIYQIIWVALYRANILLTISYNDVVFRLIRQRISDSWRNVFASTAIAAVSAWLDQPDNKKYSKTDLDRQQFANLQLMNNRFLYVDSPRECLKPGLLPFTSDLIATTFSAHYSAILGRIEVQEFGSWTSSENLPFGALALAATALQRALYLWSIGALTIQAVELSKGTSNRTVKLEDVKGENNRKISTSFTAHEWSSTTAKFVKAVCKLHNKHPELFANICTRAEEISNATLEGTRLSSLKNSVEDSDVESLSDIPDDFVDPCWEGPESLGQV
jgi:hypothetical protein